MSLAAETKAARSKAEAMSVKKIISPKNSEAVKKDQASSSSSSSSSKRRRYDSGRFLFKELSMEPGLCLKEMDSNELKAKIVRWAKAVAAYARQVSGKFGSSSRGNADKSETGSSRS